MSSTIIIGRKVKLFSIACSLVFGTTFCFVNSQETETAFSAYKSGNYLRAIELYSAQIKVNQEYAPIFYGRGLAYSKLGSNEAAIHDLSIAIKLDSKNSDAYYTRGLAYSKLANYQAALADFNKATELNSKKADYHYAKANIYYYLENDDLSIESSTQALSIDPGYALAYYGRAVAYRYKKDNAKAKADFAQFLVMNESSNTIFIDEAKRMIEAIDKESAE